MTTRAILLHVTESLHNSTHGRQGNRWETCRLGWCARVRKALADHPRLGTRRQQIRPGWMRLVFYGPRGYVGAEWDYEAPAVVERDGVRYRRQTSPGKVSKVVAKYRAA